MGLLRQVKNFSRSLFGDKSSVEQTRHSGHEVAEEGRAQMRLRRKLVGYNSDRGLAKGAEDYADKI